MMGDRATNHADMHVGQFHPQIPRILEVIFSSSSINRMPQVCNFVGAPIEKSGDLSPQVVAIWRFKILTFPTKVCRGLSFAASF
jgi:hypothetical protein